VLGLGDADEQPVEWIAMRLREVDAGQDVLVGQRQDGRPPSPARAPPTGDDDADD